ncbi:glucose-6-phosphate isomerase [Pengzhenrongella frigida]|uniref:Glucose-6-phosphate isomerase n=2 Tax=Pengzhenrongella frigida TaxID=1259133 RepID=A0A4Q5MYW1_9MICO|nr:glucose-6-phosphate isomerase [Cellulomonas sp. HLT2-17]RYV50895.1 glucose-6-phosphate isomerase [Cellulomonas sp. HLT2-17]
MSWVGDGDDPLLEVTAGGAAAAAVGQHADRLATDKIASRIAAGDAGLWGPAAEADSAIRLGWTGLHATTRAILPALAELRTALAADGIDRVVLAGMGGSSLAPEVITQTAGVPLVVLDSTDPEQVRAALAGDLARTVLVVASKSGDTVETDAQRRVFEAAFAVAGLDAGRHLVAVTDAGSPLEATARAAGYRAVFLADPTVGGRFSALSAFGVVPSALAGVDVVRLLDQAAAVADILTEDADSNPALVLAAAIAGTSPLRDKLMLVDEGSGLIGLADWVEQLVAESTGKAGRGLLPVATNSPAGEPPELSSPATDVLAVRFVALVDDVDDPAAEVSIPGDEVTVAGELGAQFLLWEYATVVAAHLLGVNPFDQPEVETAKDAARHLGAAPPDREPAAFVDGGIEVRATPDLLLDPDGVRIEDAAGVIDALLLSVPDDGYLAVTAFLDRAENVDLAQVRDALAIRTGRPVTFGWGPRFLHSTGQLHKGGPPVGVFLQLTGAPAVDFPVPGRPFTFGQLIAAQAADDAAALAAHGRPILRLHLTDRAALAHVTHLLRSRRVPA